MSVTIGTDIGGGHILSAAVDPNSGRIINKSRIYLKVDNKASKEVILDRWAEGLNTTIDKTGGLEISGIGFAMPGPFNYRTGVAMFEKTDKYEALYNVNVVDELSKRLNSPGISMRFMNDATSFAVGEAWFGKAKDAHKSIAITLGTGFGSAYIEDGVPVVDRKDVADQGCFWHIPYKEGIADDYFSTRWYLKEYKKRAGQTASGVKEMAEKARSDDSVKAIFETFGSNLGEFFVPWLKKFPAEMIVIGGNITGAFDLFSDSFQEQFQQNNIDIRLVISDLKEDAALIGSARLFDEEFWEKVNNNLPTI